MSNTLSLRPGTRLRTGGTTYEVTEDAHVPSNAVEIVPQTTRLLKVHCEACGYTCRITKRWIDKAGTPFCPCAHGLMVVAEPKVKGEDTPAKVARKAKPEPTPTPVSIVGTVDETFMGFGAGSCHAMSNDNFQCTRVFGHIGDHIAHYSTGEVCATWPAEPIAQPEPIAEPIEAPATESPLAQLIAAL